MNKLQANICLLCVTMMWSAEVIILSCMPDGVMPFAISCMTNLIGAALIFMCFFRRIISEITKAGKHIVGQCALLSVIYFTYNVLYIYGWKNFDVLTGDFTISITVVVMPVILLLTRNKVTVKMLISSALIGTGIVISLLNNQGGIEMRSLIIVIIAGILRGLFYIKLNEAAKQYDAITIAALIILFSGIVSYAAWTAMQPATFFAIPWSKTVVASLFVHAYFVTVTAQVLNIFAQRRTTAASATIIYALENVFATIWFMILPASIVGNVSMSIARLFAVVFVLLGNLTDLIRLPGLGGEDSATSDIKAAVEDGAAGSTASPQPVAAERLRPHVNVMKTGPAQKILIVLILFIVYFIISIPFKALDIMPGFTDIRPVTLLQPIYGIFFGLPGCVVLSLGNVVSDIIGGSLRISSAAGAAANFIGPFLFFIFWTKISRGPFDLRSWRNIIKYIGTVTTVAAVEVLIITPAVAYFYPDVEYVKFAVIVLLNTIVFPVALGIPFTILIQEELGFKPIRLIKQES